MCILRKMYHPNKRFSIKSYFRAPSIRKVPQAALYLNLILSFLYGVAFGLCRFSYAFVTKFCKFRYLFLHSLFVSSVAVGILICYLPLYVASPLGHLFSYDVFFLLFVSFIGFRFTKKTRRSSKMITAAPKSNTPGP